MLRPAMTLFALLLLTSWSSVVGAQDAQELSSEDEPKQHTTDLANGPVQRLPWTTSRVVGSPDPPSAYQVKVAFPHLKFDEPVAITSFPATNRLVVVQRFGKIYTFDNSAAARELHLLIDVPKALGVDRAETFGIAFHPKFADSGQFFVHHHRPGVELPTRVSRFEVEDLDRFQADPASEQLILSWPNGHNGGCVKFGHDGYLYVSNGDQGGLHDPGEVGQGIADLQASILRIDVDATQADLAYRIPADNPFVDIAAARHEVWAYGLRNPWKFSFDRQTGELWAADVGEDLWESIHIVKRGGNYGWSVEEGGRPFRPERQRGPTPIQKPIVAHDHSEARSITGGYVYRGARLPELGGHYIYGDYDTGKVWMLGYDGQQVTEHREICDSSIRLVAFGEDQAGELLLVDHIGGYIHHLQQNAQVDTSASFPRKLSETGLFESTVSLNPAAGLIPYEVVAPQWTDGSTKQRYLALPDSSQIEFEAVRFPFRGGRDGWKFPDGAVLVETHSMEMDAEQPQHTLRLETRILHHERLNGPEDVGDQLWRGYTYIWNDDQTDAVLLEDPRGKDIPLVIRDASAPDGQRRQTWHVPGRTECSICHNMAAKYVLGCQTLQTNHERTVSGSKRNQLQHFQQIGLFSAPLPKPVSELPSLTDYHDLQSPLAARARSYLHANCSHCHRNGGGGNAEFFALASFDLEQLKLVGAVPSHGRFHIPDGKIVKPGSPFESLVYYRMTSLGGSRMPRLGSSMVDEKGASLLYDWISSLDANGTSEASKSNETRDVRQSLTTTAGAMALARAIELGDVSESARKTALEMAMQAELHIRDLFERFLPESDRTQRLGNSVDAAAILAMEGDPTLGKQLFFQQSGVQCKSCHRIGDVGKQVGPDLDLIGKKFDRTQVLTSILKPSLRIDAEYLQYNCVTVDGRTYSGIVVEKNEQAVTIRDANSNQIELTTEDIEVLAAQTTSLMPELLVRDLTAQQLADLVAYLGTLK